MRRVRGAFLTFFGCGNFWQFLPAAAFSGLDDMINRMRKEGLIPSSIENCLGSLKSFGNFASHDQEEDPQNTSVEMAESTLLHLRTLVEWYETQNLHIEQKNK